MRSTAALAIALLTPAPLFAQTIVYVSAALTTGADDGSSWSGAYRGPQALKRALDLTPAGAQLWVAQGRYTPAAPGGPRRAAFTLKDDVAIYGGFAGGETDLGQRNPFSHTTILSADLNGDDAQGHNEDNTIHLIIAPPGLDQSARVDGVIIEGGYAWGVDGGVGVSDTDGANIRVQGSGPSFFGCTIRGGFAQDGAGVAITGGGAPLFSACTFTHNSAQGRGGGAWNGPGGAGRFQSCQFTANTGGLGAGLFNGDFFPGGPAATAAVTGSAFSDNVGDIGLGAGPGAYDTSSASFATCSFRRNRTGAGGGGLFCDGSTTTVDRCLFFQNEASFDGGDALYVQGPARPVFTSCAFFAHSGPGSIRASGATVFITSADPAFINCTFANNNLAGTFFGLGAIYASAAPCSVSIDNCIFWNNRDSSGTGQSAAITRTAGVLVTVNHSIVQGWTGSLPGAGSFAADPLFASPSGSDGIAGTADDLLTLLPLSPAIDSADNAPLLAALTAPFTDLAGQTRFIDDPSTADTGVGAPPFADRGAFEFQPVCMADLTADGLLDFSDYLTFLNYYDSGDLRADFNHDRLVDFSDYLEFLNLFSGDCLN